MARSVMLTSSRQAASGRTASAISPSVCRFRPKTMRGQAPKRFGASAGEWLWLGDVGQLGGVLGYKHGVVREDREPVVHPFCVGSIPPVAKQPRRVGERQPAFGLVDFDREGHCLRGKCLKGC